MSDDTQEKTVAEEMMDAAITALIGSRNITREQMAVEIVAIEQISRNALGGIAVHMKNSMEWLETIEPAKDAPEREKELYVAFRQFIGVAAQVVEGSSLAMQSLPTVGVINDAFNNTKKGKKGKLIQPGKQGLIKP